MHTFLFLNQRRRVRLSWPWVLAACGCTVFAEPLAPSASTAAHECQIALEPAGREQIVIPSAANSGGQGEQPPSVLMLAVAGVLEPRRRSHSFRIGESKPHLPARCAADFHGEVLPMPQRAGPIRL